MSSNDTRHDGSEDQPLDPEATRPAKPITVPWPEEIGLDEEGDEATVMARVPDELLADSNRPKEEPTKGGLRQMFPREPAPARAALPSVEGDALLDMLFEDASEDPKAEGEASLDLEEVDEVPRAMPEPEPTRPMPRPPRRPPPGVPRSPLEQVASAVVVSEPEPEHETEAPRSAPSVVEDASTMLDLDAEGADVPELIESDPPPAMEVAPSESLRIAAPITTRQVPVAAFDREEDASALLLRAQQRDAWVERAEWLRAEAGALSDFDSRARALLVVSELYAMAGE
ncbi:MAG: hypothetical protein ACMG6S_17140, partial [Byssovorax sp.]